jgi:hypothetical protein
MKIGCPNGEAEAAITSTTTEKATTTSASPTFTPFDCEADSRMWVRGWSDGKKDWCCRHTGKGCPTTTTPVSFTCEPVSNWESAWSDVKKEWCCRHQQTGCAGKSI